MKNKIINKEYKNTHPEINVNRFAPLGDEPLNKEKINEILKNHQNFLKQYDGSGVWNTMLVTDDLIMGIFTGANFDTSSQADFSRKNIEDGDFSGKELVCINMSGTLCRQKDFTNSNLEKSLGVDSNYSNTIFKNTNLKGSDFSRSIMQNCDFRGANLTAVDFENCDLRGSDFTGAVTEGAMFPGVLTDDCIGLELE